MDIIQEVEAFFSNEEKEVQQFLSPLLPGLKGIYQTVKSDAEAALKAAGSQFETMALADWNSLMTTIQGAVKTAAGNTTMTGQQKFESVATSIFDAIKNNVWPTIPVIAQASVNALVNVFYTGLLAGLL